MRCVLHRGVQAAYDSSVCRVQSSYTVLVLGTIDESAGCNASAGKAYAPRKDLLGTSTAPGTEFADGRRRWRPFAIHQEEPVTV